MSTLLNRSILSHIIPVVLTVLLIGGVLGYALETHLFVTIDAIETPVTPTITTDYPPPILEATPTLADDSLQRDLELLRYWIIGGVVIALLVGVNLASLSAYYLERPLARLTGAVQRMTKGEPLPALETQGPQEITALVTAFNDLNLQLKTVETSREQLLTNVVHELGRPLGAMRMAVRALRDGAVEDTVFREELFIGIEEEIQRLNRLLDNLVQLGGSVLKTFEVHRKPVPLAEWLPTLLPLWQPTATAKGLTWQSDIPATLPIMEIDPDRLGQVMGNLLSNAIRYTPAGGHISVRAGQKDASLWIEVSDTGIGIPLEEQNKVFDPFFRSSAHTRFPQGMGLGLPIAREIVTAHGGNLTVSSTVGEGTTFRIVLPIIGSSSLERDDL
jgi:two-component system sensor histidine kinase BaeS